MTSTIDGKMHIAHSSVSGLMMHDFSESLNFQICSINTMPRNLIAQNQIQIFFMIVMIDVNPMRG
jgi:hypothetical protein